MQYYKDIAVHVDNSASIRDRLITAANFAKAQGAHLTGIHVRHLVQVPHFVAAQLGPDIAALQRRHGDEAAAKARALFDKVCDGVGVEHEFRSFDGETLDQLCLNCRYADLIVMGQHDPDADGGDDSLVDHVVLECGRPVLVVPYAGRYESVGKRIMVAWNGTREAVRAVHDALPLLASADKVDILVVNPDRSMAGHGDVPGADIALHLSRHGVRAEAHQIKTRDMEIGDVILSRSADIGSDLIVMGAYGRSRLRELVLGGATRHLLEHMTSPVLMAH